MAEAEGTVSAHTDDADDADDAFGA